MDYKKMCEEMAKVLKEISLEDKCPLFTFMKIEDVLNKYKKELEAEKVIEPLFRIKIPLMKD